MLMSVTEVVPVLLGPIKLPDRHACDVLRIGMSTLYRRFNSGDIRPIEVGGATLIPHSEIERVTESRI